MNAFSESLRQEVTRRHVRVALIEPGAVATELAGHNRPEAQDAMRKRFEGVDLLQAEEIATGKIHGNGAMRSATS